MKLGICLSGHLFLRRRWRWLRRFYRDVLQDVRYRHVWHPTTTAQGYRVYRCRLCGAQAGRPVGGHQDPCRKREHKDLRVVV
jgi:hypothetical protein